MRRIHHCIRVALLMTLVATATAIAQQQPRADCVVAPGGRDTGKGTLDDPFQTLEQARDAVRMKIASGLRADVVVLLREGVYRLDETLTFGPDDGGTAKHKVIYQAYPGEKVVISGGRPLAGWKSAGDGMWTLDLPEVRDGRWWFRQLFADGRRMPRGRWPATGFLKIKSCSPNGKALQFEQPLPATDLGGKDTEVVVLEYWSIAREIVASNSGDLLEAATSIGWRGHSACLAKPGMAAFLEHSSSFVKKPGQWYLDRSRGQLHYQAAKGENLNRREFIAPVVEQLVKIEGTKRQPVRNLHFRGIEFGDAAWKLPETGYDGIQACHYGPVKGEDTFAVGVAIELTCAEDCSLADCRVVRVGGSALGLGAGCRRNRIVGCELADIGANGLMVGYVAKGKPLDGDWSDSRDIPIGNEISNCYVHHCGATLFGAVGIFDAMTQDTRIIHNEVAHLLYTGISTGFKWDSKPSSQKHCLIGYNHIHDVMELMNDGGAIYTLGYQPGSIIRGNLMHGVGRSGYAFGRAPNNGIFFDQGSKGFHVEENIIYDTTGKALRFNSHKKDSHTWRANTFDLTPDDPKFPREIAEEAGIEPSRRRVRPDAP